MGFFSPTQKHLDWIELQDIAQFNEFYNSDEQLVIFKHSTRCSISSFALRNFEREFPTDSLHRLLFLDLIKHRDISDLIAEKTGIMHQSPQVLGLSNKEVRYHASHEQINATLLNSIL